MDYTSLFNCVFEGINTNEQGGCFVITSNSQINVTFCKFMSCSASYAGSFLVGETNYALNVFCSFFYRSFSFDSLSCFKSSSLTTDFNHSYALLCQNNHDFGVYYTEYGESCFSNLDNITGCSGRNDGDIDIHCYHRVLKCQNMQYTNDTSPRVSIWEKGVESLMFEHINFIKCSGLQFIYSSPSPVITDSVLVLKTFTRAGISSLFKNCIYDTIPSGHIMELCRRLDKPNTIIFKMDNCLNRSFRFTLTKMIPSLCIFIFVCLICIF